MAELFLRAAALMLSFLGLCEAARTLLKVNRFVAPSVAAGVIIVVLMIAGFVDGLLFGVWLLYAAGWVYWVYNLLKGRRRPEWLVILLCVAVVAVLAWKLWPAKMSHPDDFSHWGLAVESLLRRDAFPDASERVITYQSYPMGATVFIYYVTRLLGNQESLRFIAQNFLCAALLFSIFSLVEDGKGWTRALAVVFFGFLYKFNRSYEVLQVDWLQSYFGVSIASVALYYRNDLRKATLTALPCLVAVALTKNSGLFFTAVGVLTLVLATDRARCTRRQLWKMAILAAVVPVAMYLMWTLHVKFSFSSGFESKHAVSVSAYAQIAGEKTPRTILLIGWNMIRRWLKLSYIPVLTVGFAAASFALTYWMGRSLAQKEEVRRLKQWLLGCFVVFVLWHAMLFVMYVFSMPLEEAQSLASYSRYTTSGLILPLGMAMAAQLKFFCCEQCGVGRRMAIAWGGLILICVVTLPLIKDDGAWWDDLGRADERYFDTRSEVLWAREEYDLPEDGNYLIFADDSREMDLWGIGYRAKYDLYSADMVVAMLTDDVGMNVYTAMGRERVEDVAGWLDEKMDACDAVILLSEKARCEELLEACGSDTPVVKAVGKRVEDLWM